MISYSRVCLKRSSIFFYSAPSKDKNATDFIDYTVQEQSLVTGLQILPYRAFWHPHSPTYSPQHVSLSFYAKPLPSSANKLFLYQSPWFLLVNEMQLQEFELPQPIWLPEGAIMRLNMRGRFQAETTELLPWLRNDEQGANYYSCLSFVNEVGKCSIRTISW